MINHKEHIVLRDGDYVLWKDTPRAVAWTAMAYQTWYLLTDFHLKDKEIRRVTVRVDDEGV